MRIKRAIITIILTLFIGIADFSAVPINIMSNAATDSAKITGFIAKARTCSTITLTWNKVRGANGYVIYRYNPTSKKWNVLTTLTSQQSVFTVKKLMPMTEYCFAIRYQAYNRCQQKNILSSNCSKLYISTMLIPVSQLKASPSTNSATLTWNSVTGADGYVIYKYNESKNIWERYIKTQSNSDKITINNLKDSTKYYFTIRAHKTIGGREILSESFPIINFTTLSSPIKNLNVLFAETQAKLSWSKINNAQSYKIYVLNGHQWKLCGKTNSTAYICNNLSVGTAYIFGVSYVENGIENPVKTTIEGTTLPGIVNFTVSKSPNTVLLKWSPRSEADEYIIYIMMPGGSWKRVAITHNCNYILQNINVTKYYVTVRASTTYNGTRCGSDFKKAIIKNTPFSAKMYVNGDSINYGSGAHGYSAIAQYAEKHNINVVNHSTAGGTIASGILNRYHIAENVIRNVDNTYDYILIDGGINDYYTSAPLGHITPKGTTSFDMSTTCGAFETMITHIKSRCSNAQIYFLSVHNIKTASKPNLLNFTYTDYLNALISICKKYNITVIDCYNSNFNSLYTYTHYGIYPNGDGIHPTELGYNKFYLPIIERVIN